MDNHGGIFLLITTTGQTQQLVFKREYGLMASMAMLSHRLRTSSLNFSGHVSSICFMAIESIGIHITPNSLLCEAFHPCNIANSLLRKSIWILGIISMSLNILKWGPHDLPLFFYLSYLSCPHFRHISLSAYYPLYIIQSFGRAWYYIYSTPNIFNNFFASSQLLGKTLSLGRTLSLNNL